MESSDTFRDVLTRSFFLFSEIDMYVNNFNRFYITRDNETVLYNLDQVSQRHVVFSVDSILSFK